MKLNNLILVAMPVLLVAASLLACDLSSLVGPVTPVVVTATPVPATATSAVLVVTATPLPPTKAPVVTPMPVSPTPAPDISGATLTLQDMPQGFEVMSEADLAKLNFSEDALTRSFSGASSQAKVQNFTAFLNSQNLQMIFAFLLYPLSPMEKASLDLALSNPDAALKSFATGSAGATVLPGMDIFGDRSFGYTSVSGKTPPLRMDVVIVSRGPAMEIVMTFYQDGTQPSIGVGKLTQILDSRVATALGAK